MMKARIGFKKSFIILVASAVFAASLAAGGTVALALWITNADVPGNTVTVDNPLHADVTGVGFNETAVPGGAPVSKTFTINITDGGDYKLAVTDIKFKKGEQQAETDGEWMLSWEIKNSQGAWISFAQAENGVLIIDGGVETGTYSYTIAIRVKADLSEFYYGYSLSFTIKLIAA